MSVLAASDSQRVDRNHHYRTSMTGLMIGVASCALIACAGLRDWNGFKGNDSIRQLASRAGSPIERRSVADDQAHDTRRRLPWARLLPMKPRSSF